MASKTKKKGWNSHVICRDVMDRHNEYRLIHGCPVLKWGQDLGCLAQSWADKLADRNLKQYYEHPVLGDNVFMVNLSDAHDLGKTATDRWYSEIRFFDFSDPKWSKDCMHFSQVVWQSSQEIGVGVSRNAFNAFVVALYRPGGNGNLPGEFEKNIQPPWTKM